MIKWTKSRQGKCSASQRAAREALLRAGADWWECRSAHAAMWALRKSGVKFRTIVHEDGSVLQKHTEGMIEMV